MRLVRPKSLSKLRESIRPRTRRTNGQSMNAIVVDLNRTLVGWYAHIKHVKGSALAAVDGWIRMRLRSILRKRRGGKGRGHCSDHQRWPHRYLSKLGLFCLLDAQKLEIASLRNGANY
jgi:RNA-directed DNA polymerase